MLPKSVAHKLISGFRCSNCSKDFDENAIRIVRFDEGLFVLKITCNNCSKSFGLAFLGLSEEDILKSVPNEIKASPITYDDVLDAHQYIQNLDENWKKFIQNIKTNS